jgi:hypothetical protein
MSMRACVLGAFLAMISGAALAGVPPANVPIPIQSPKTMVPVPIMSPRANVTIAVPETTAATSPAAPTQTAQAQPEQTQAPEVPRPGESKPVKIYWFLSGR